MKLSIILSSILIAILCYGISIIRLSFWGWIEILVALAFFSVFILPSIIAWIVNLFLSKRKQFSFSCDRFSPFGLYIKNACVSFKANYFRITVRLKKISVQTNFKKSLLGISTTSPFVLELDNLDIGIIPEAKEDQTVEKPVLTKQNFSKDRKDSITETKNGDTTSFSLPRIVVLFLRLLDVHVNNIILSLGDQSFPKRIEVLINDVSFSGTAQYTSMTTVGLTLTLRSISLNNRENAFDREPNVTIYNCWLRISGILTRRLILQQVGFNLGDYIHVQMDKSLYRQVTALMKAIDGCKPPKISVSEAKEHEGIIGSDPIEKLQRLIVAIPHAVKITMPKLEIDIMNADKSNTSEHNALHLIVGGSFKFSSSFFDVFFMKPKTSSIYIEISTIESSFVTCEGVDVTLNVGFRETMNRIDSISLLYNHKKTSFICRPSLFRTFEYMLSMVNRFPSTIRKPSKKKRGPWKQLIVLLAETSVKVDLHVEEMALELLPSSFISTPATELSIQSLSFSYFPSSSRMSVDSVYSSMNEVHFKVGAIELKTMSTSKEALRKLTRKSNEMKSTENLKIPPCSEKILSFCNMEVNSTLTKFERVSVDCISKSSNINLTFASMDLLIDLLEFYQKEFVGFKERQSEISKSPSCNSFSKSPSVASFSKSPSATSLNSLSDQTKPFSIMPEHSEGKQPAGDMENDDVFIQSILNHTLLPDGIDKLLPFNEVVSSNGVNKLLPFNEVVSSNGVDKLPSFNEVVSSNGVDKLLPSNEVSPSNEGLTPLSPPSEVILLEQMSESMSDEGELDEIFLSEKENEINSMYESFSFLPYYLTDFSIHLYSMELQVSGLDSTKSTSYSVESITLALVSKNIDSFDRSEELSVVYNRFGDVPSPSLPVYPSISPTEHLAVISEVHLTPSAVPLQHKPISMDLERIPSFAQIPDDELSGNSLQEIPSLSSQTLGSPQTLPPIQVRAARRSSHPLTSVLPSNQYQRNSGIEYSLSIECTNITIMGDEGSSLPKSQLPLFIPQIQVTFPSLVFIAISSNQLPSSISEIAIRYKSFSYLPHKLGKFHGFKRGDESLFFLTTTAPAGNIIQLNLNSLFVRLAYGSIYVIYHSFVDLVTLIKQSSFVSELQALRPPKEKPVVSAPKTSFGCYQFMLTLSRCNITLHFTAKEGIFVYVDSLSATYPESSDFPLLSASNCTISKVQGFSIVSTLFSIDQIEVFSPDVYETIAITRHLHDSNSSIDEVRKKVFECCDNGGHSHRYVSCPTCLKHPVSSFQCNGYDNQCNHHASHIPVGVKPFVVIAGHVDCSQDSDYPWGDLFYDAALQWKAFKTLRKGPKAPPPYPSADVTCLATVADHDEISDSTILEGYWVQVCIDEIFLRLNDIVPEVSSELMEYSRVEIIGLNGVLNYNKRLHSRSHFLKFIESMDEVPTPFDKGFEDVLGLHLHDIYVENVGIDFGESLPPLVVGTSLFGCGTLVFAEMNRCEKYVRSDSVELYCSDTFDSIPVTVTRSAIPMKFFTNLSLQAKQFEVNWGNPHDIVRTSLIHSFGILTPNGIGKSPKLVWYDKLRFSIHGEIRIRVSELFRVNWMTLTQRDKKFESLTIDFVNPCVDFYKMGGLQIRFDEFSIGISRFVERELELKPLIIVDDSEMHIKLVWGNKDTKNHYVELSDAVDDSDRYFYYRSHTIEWNIDLVPTDNRQFSTTLLLRMEAIGFLMDFWNLLKKPSLHIDKAPNLMRNATVFNINFVLDNTRIWCFLNDSSENGFNVLAKNTSLSLTMYKLLPKYFASVGNKDRMNHSSKPDYSEMIYAYEYFEQMEWIYPRLLLKLKQVVLNHLYLIHPQDFVNENLHPFWNPDNLSLMLIAQVQNLAVVKGVDTTSGSSSGMDEELASLYNERIQSNNLKLNGKNESKCAVLMNGLKVIYSLDVRDALMMTIHDYSPIYAELKNKPKPTTPVPSVESPIHVTTPEVTVVPRQPLQRQQSIPRGLNDNRRDAGITSSITRSISGTAPAFYRSESSCFINHMNSTDSYRLSLTSSLNRHRLDILRSSNTSYRQTSEHDNRLLLSRLNSNSGFRMSNETSFQQRRKQKDRFYQEMKNMEKEAAKVKSEEDPQLLTYLMKKASHVNVKKENGVMIVSDSDVMVKRDDGKKDDKEDFLYGIFLTDSQIYIPSVETGSSLLLYMYQGTMVVQNKTIQQRDYNVIHSSLTKVDLFLGTRDTQNHPWISMKGVSQMNSKSYKRIIQDFSLSLMTRSQNGFIPTTTTNNPSFRREDLVNRVTVNIGSFSVRMTSEEFYRFLNVIQFTLLVNPTNSSTMLNKKKSDSPVRKNPSELISTIENKVLSIVSGNDNEMIPVLKIKYTLEEVEWSLLGNSQNEIAVATLKGLIGDHTFCYDSKSENKITLNDLRITNPSYSIKEQYWNAPDVILDPVPLDRDKDEQSNMLEVIAVLSNQYTCDGIAVQIFEHVGINVYPGCQYYILFQLTGEVATGIFRYFFPDDDETETISVTSFDTPSEITLEEDVKPKSPSIMVEDIKMEVSEDDLDFPPFVDDTAITIKERRSTTPSENTSVSSSTGRFKNKKFNNGCSHEFELIDATGNCVVCKRKIGTARYLAYRCNQCGIMVDKNCMMKALGRNRKRKEGGTHRLVFFEHFRIGTVEMNISTKGMSPLNLNNFYITLQHQIYSNKLTEWNKMFKSIKKAYTSELLKSAPSFMLRGWGFRDMVRSNELRDKKKEDEEDPNEALTEEMKISLLLGI